MSSPGISAALYSPVIVSSTENMSLPRSLSTPGVLTQFSGGGKVLRRPNRPGSLKISQQANLNRLSSMSSMDMSSLEDLVVTMENICRHLVNKNYSMVVVSALHGLCNSLHHYGVQLDTLYKDQLDKLMVVFRTSCRDEELDLFSRVEILHIIELRAAGWNTNDNMVAYYKQKVNHLDKMRESPQIQTAPVSLNANAPDFNPSLGHSGSQSSLLVPGEVVGSSGKFSQPTRIPGKNYFKDEVVIRNADSGKVMGLKGRRVHMIEQLTETVVSFQRVVPGARERLVQITGPGHDNIVQAKLLIEETIRRNQSPIPRDDVMGSPNESLGSCEGDSRRNTLIADREAVPLTEYKYTVNVADECIRITGASLDLVRTAKLVLEEYFSLGDTVNDMNKVLLKDTNPTVRPTFSLGPPDTPPLVPSKLGSSRSAFESVGSRRLQPLKLESQDQTSEAPITNFNHFQPELSYSREELLNLANTPGVHQAAKHLYAKFKDHSGIKRKEANQLFDGKVHLEKGLDIFSTADYVRSYNMAEGEFE